MHVIFSQCYRNYQQVLSSNTEEFTWKIAPQVIILTVNSYSKMWLSKVITINYRALSSVQSLSRVPFANPWTAARQASVCITSSEFTQTHVEHLETTEILKEIRIINDHITERVYFFLSNYFTKIIVIAL